LRGPAGDVPLEFGLGQLGQRELLAECGDQVVEVDAGGVEGVLLVRAGMRRQEAVAECYSWGVTERGGGGRFRRPAVVPAEIGDVHAGRQVDQTLLEAEEQVIDLGEFGLRLLLGDLPEREREQPAAEAE